MSAFRVFAHAKVNLFLHIGARRDDGFHALESLFQTISLHDELEVQVAEQYELLCSDPSLPTDRRNLVTRAFWLLREAFGVPTMRVRLRKQIPAGGGLGGGSSDAAALLRVAGPLLDTTFDPGVLHQIAAELGSDVPFFLHGGTAYATGRGDVVAPLPDTPQQPLTLLLPPFGVSTPACYAKLAQLRSEGVEEAKPFGGLREASRLAQLPLSDWPIASMRNDLENPAFRLEPLLGEMAGEVARAGGLSLMSGSGSTLFSTATENAVRSRGLGAELVAVRTVGRGEALRIER